MNLVCEVHGERTPDEVSTALPHLQTSTQGFQCTEEQGFSLPGIRKTLEVDPKDLCIGSKDFTPSTQA